MKPVSRLLMVACVSMSFSSVALAGHKQIPGFAEMKKACKNPSQYQNQNAPLHMKITCEDKETIWTEDMTESHTLENTRRITSSLTSDKYSTSEESACIESPAQAVGCHVYTQIEITVKTDQDVSCDQIEQYPTADAMCKDILDDLKKGMKQDNAIQQMKGKQEQSSEIDGMKLHYTGAKYNTCSSNPVQQQVSPIQQQMSPVQQQVSPMQQQDISIILDQVQNNQMQKKQKGHSKKHY